MSDEIPATFVTHAAGILAESMNGLSGSQIIQLTSAHAVDENVTLKHTTMLGAPNKRTVLYDNLLCFSGGARFTVIKALCDHSTFKERNQEQVAKLKLDLVTQYGHLDQHPTSDINPALVEETKHWLDPFPEARETYVKALQKHQHRMFHRNVLDDLRLALEQLLRSLFKNEKSLENQIQLLGQFVKENGGSPEFSNMFVKLVEYYSKYQNTYVKHDDAVNEKEVEFVFELTSSFMKHLVRLWHDAGGK